jgi:alkaline phosphatase
MLFGHRNNPQGYAGAIEEFDARLPEVITEHEDRMTLLIISADHGCDPTTQVRTIPVNTCPYWFSARGCAPSIWGPGKPLLI